MKKRGLSTIATAIIIMSLVIAIGIVVIIIYNVVSQELEFSSESNISLEIQKDSVVISEDKKILLTVARGVGDAVLEKIKFVVSDGEKNEEIERDAKDLIELDKMDFNFAPKMISTIKTIAVVPIIKVNGKLRYLSVAHSIEIKEKEGKIIIEEVIPVCGNSKLEKGEQCDDGNQINGDGCSMLCKVEVETDTSDDDSDDDGGTIIPATPVCSDGTCDSTEDCSSCPGDCGVCELCGNGVLNSGEGCDSGDSNTNTPCTTSYGQNCTYCDTSCQSHIVVGARCGDGTCDPENEDYAGCPGDCPLCTQGDTQQCGSTDVGTCAYGTQTCGADNEWGSCVGSVEPVAEVCNSGLDKDCDGLSDCADSDCNGQTCASGKICSGGSCVLSCSDECTPSGQKVCDGSGYKICGDYDADSCLEWGSIIACGTCKTCSSGNCVNVADGQVPNNQCGTTGCYTGNCNGAGACAYYTSGQHNCGGCRTCDASGSCVGEGYSYGGYCWYTDIATKSCDTICSGHGGCTSNEDDSQKDPECEVCLHYWGHLTSDCLTDKAAERWTPGYRGWGFTSECWVNIRPEGLECDQVGGDADNKVCPCEY